VSFSGIGPVVSASPLATPTLKARPPTASSQGRMAHRHGRPKPGTRRGWIATLRRKRPTAPPADWDRAQPRGASRRIGWTIPYSL
jgi:hypothetical protein